MVNLQKNWIFVLLVNDLYDFKNWANRFGLVDREFLAKGVIFVL